MSRPPRLPWPADVYLEGHDQYRGWFHSSLLVAVNDRFASPCPHLWGEPEALDRCGVPTGPSGVAVRCSLGAEKTLRRGRGEVQAVATAGERMPHKSTYFFPKPLTGLVINVMEE